MRKEYSKKYIKGSGIEIGARHNPWPTESGVDVTYVDLLSREQLLKQESLGPQLDAAIPHTGIIDDGETLDTFTYDNIYDFVVTSHVLEHFPNPIGAIGRWLDVLKVGGYIVMAVPEKTETFDKDRRVTQWVELYDVYLNPIDNYNRFKRQQFSEWAFLRHNFQDEQQQDYVNKAMADGRNIHFPVWNETEFRYFIDRICNLFQCKLVAFERRGFEMFVVLEKLR